MKSELIARAEKFAYSAHASQKRKYTGDPYIVHPKAVAALVESVNGTDEQIAAAWLHDTVEDTGATIETIGEMFGVAIALLVEQLTDVSKPSDGNRAARKAIDLAHTAKCSPEAATIKLADLIDNSHSIIERDPSFAKVYLGEKKRLLEILRHGDKGLWGMAHSIVNAQKEEK